MFINQTVAKELYTEAGEARLFRARAYVKQNRVSIETIHYENMNNFSVSSFVEGNFDDYRAYIEVKNGELNSVKCECEDYKSHYGACKHIVATMLEIDGNPKYNEKKYKKTKEKYTDFSDLINTFYDKDITLMDEGQQQVSVDKNVKIVPKIMYDKFSGEMKIEFKIGTKKQLYKLRDLVEFYDNMQNNVRYKYGAKLDMIHEEATFEKEDLPLLNFILKHAETIKFINNSSNSIYRYYGKVMNTGNIVLSNTVLDEIFEILKNKTVTLEKDYFTKQIQFVETIPDIKFELEKISQKEYKLMCSIDTYNTYEILQGKKYTYFLLGDKIYRCTKEYEETTLKLLEVFRRNFTREIKFSKDQVPTFFSIVLPKVEKSISLDTIEPEEVEKYMPQKLGVKVFLEFNEKNYIIAKVIFCYKDQEFNPLQENPNIPRDVMGEAESLNLFRKTGFMLDKQNARFVLVEDDKIYNFLSSDINEYMQKFEVLATDDFNQKQIKRPKMSALGVKIENNLLNVNLEDFNFDKRELNEILSKYRLKKKYHRLKNGDFISLEENTDIDFLDNLIAGTEISYKELETGNIKLPIYRTLYLERIMNRFENTTIKKADSYKEITNNIEDKTDTSKIVIPKSLSKTLRQYQKIGFKWLQTLDKYQFGGILADDMGLGKTIQMISIILSYIENCKENKKPIMVVCPSSLSLNWKAEIQKFANNIDAIFQVGKGGISPALIKQVDDALEARELIKLSVLETSPDDNFFVANELAMKTNSVLVQVMGNKVTLYRPKKKNPRIVLPD